MMVPRSRNAKGVYGPLYVLCRTLLCVTPQAVTCASPNIMLTSSVEADARQQQRAPIEYRSHETKPDARTKNRFTPCVGGPRVGVETRGPRQDHDQPLTLAALVLSDSATPHQGRLVVATRDPGGDGVPFCILSSVATHGHKSRDLSFTLPYECRVRTGSSPVLAGPRVVRRCAAIVELRPLSMEFYGCAPTRVRTLARIKLRPSARYRQTAYAPPPRPVPLHRHALQHLAASVLSHVSRPPSPTARMPPAAPSSAPHRSTPPLPAFSPPASTQRTRPRTTPAGVYPVPSRPLGLLHLVLLPQPPHARLAARGIGRRDLRPHPTRNNQSGPSERAPRARPGVL
ncbi:unnamed protein product [Boreogadus saida]